MPLPGVFVAGKISTLADMAAKWQAGYPLAKAEFDDICRQREEELKALQEYIEKQVRIIEKLAKMLELAFAELENAKKAMAAARAELQAAKPGTPEESHAQQKVAQAEADYMAARTRYLEIEAEKKKKEAFKEYLDKEYARWKDALDAFRRRGEERLLELDRRGQELQRQTDKVIRLTKEGHSIDA